MAMHVSLSERWTGLCNQLFALVNGIVDKRKYTRCITIGPFAIDINSDTKIPADLVFDLVATGDATGVTLSTQNKVAKSDFRWFADEHEFVNVLRQLRFQKVFYDMADTLVEPYTITPIHVAHFRIEADALAHWSKMNKMAMSAFENTLHAAYTKAIVDHIPNGQTIFCLTDDKDNAFFDTLRRNYNLVFFNTRDLVRQRVGHTGRELCAVVDLLCGTRCSGVFVGCHNFERRRGSTFSYVLWRLMSSAQKGVFIDLDDIRVPLKVV